jgi:predicted N-acetyltransferase YhbS
MNTALRPATPRDAAAIANVHVGVWRDAYPTLLPAAYLTRRLSEAQQRTAWHSRLARPRRETVLVADLADSGIQGYIAFGPCRRSGFQKAAEIYELYVATARQDCGIGRSLVLKSFSEMIRGGSTSAIVEVLAGNPARFFYERMNARPVASAVRPFGGRRLEVILYRWKDLAEIAER